MGLGSRPQLSLGGCMPLCVGGGQGCSRCQFSSCEIRGKADLLVFGNLSALMSCKPLDLELLSGEPGAS